MSTIHFNETTTSTPEQFVAALTDFGPGRSKLFGNSADDYLKVHSQGPGDADVTEGSRGVWERLHYDWSDPNRVVMKTTDSKRVGRPLGPHLHVHAAARREHRCGRRRGPGGGKNLKGRVLGFVLGTVGKGALVKAFGKTVKAVEARHNGARATELT